MITSKQRAILRGMANSIRPIFQVGKGEIGDTFIRQVNEALEARELIKITVLENSLLSAREAAEIVCSQTGADPVSVIGSKFVLYKESVNKKTIEI